MNERGSRLAVEGGESREEFPRLGAIVARIWARHLREQGSERTEAKGLRTELVRSKGEGDVRSAS